MLAATNFVFSLVKSLGCDLNSYLYRQKAQIVKPAAMIPIAPAAVRQVSAVSVELQGWPSEYRDRDM